VKLNQRVWHGYYREEGEEITPDKREASDTRDGHGCLNKWARDSRGHLINVWQCEVSA
jgi:hypothetical protein